MAEPIKEGRKLEYPEKTPGDKFQKCHILKPEDSSPKHWWVPPPRRIEPTMLHQAGH